MTAAQQQPSRTRRDAPSKTGRAARATSRPPAHLDKAAADLWRRLHQAFDISDPASVALLTTTTEAEMRCRRCREKIASDGETILDRFGQVKSHPLLASERDSRAAFMAGLRALNVDPAAV